MDYPKVKVIYKPIEKSDLIEIPEEKLVSVICAGNKYFVNNKTLHFEIRETGELKHKSIYIDNSYGSVYDWKLVVDGEGALCLVPLKKN